MYARLSEGIQEGGEWSGMPSSRTLFGKDCTADYGVSFLKLLPAAKATRAARWGGSLTGMK